MPVLYTAKEIQEVLRELRIKPKDGKVNGREAAQILTWRAKQEQGIEHIYLDSAIRSHVKYGNLKVAEQVNSRFNLYRVEDIFDLNLSPRKGITPQEDSAKKAA